MENGTAGDEALETPAEHQDDQTVDNEEEESPANMKEVDGRMKLAISALIRSTITPDLELRSGSSQSLSRIARVQPITVLSEWLVVLSSEREKLVKTQHGKKKSQEEGIEPEAYEPWQTDKEAARDQQILDDIFDTC